MAEMWTISLLLFVRFAAGKLSGDHVCHTEEKYTVNVTEYIVRNATVRKYQWCLNVPPRCSFYTTRLVNESHIVGKEVTDLIEKCCPGFEEDNSTNTCQQSCPECKNGICKSGKCDCSAGFKGHNCDKECDPSEWGKNCKNQCKCQKGTCHPQNGFCDCPEGWAGLQCEFPCPNGYFGKKCAGNCSCSRGKKCHHVSGMCYFPLTSTTTPKTEPSTETSTNTVVFQNNGKFHTNANGLVSVEPTQTMSPGLSIHRSDNNKDVINSTSNYMLVQEVTSVGQDLNKDTKERVNSTTSSTIINQMSKSKVMKAAPPEKEFDNSSAAPVENYLNDQSPQNNLEQPQQDKSELVNSASAATAVSITIILVAVVIVGANRVRKAKRQNADDGPKAGVPTVSVYTHTHSIFHTPLPDPPPFENPIFITPIEQSPAAAEGQRFETRVVCSMNFPKLPSSKDPREYLYDHPPSTGSYRAASIPEPPDIDTLSSMAHSEPVYDEIPSSMAPTPISMPPPSYKSSSSLYMNTCAKTRF